MTMIPPFSWHNITAPQVGRALVLGVVLLLCSLGRGYGQSTSTLLDPTTPYQRTYLGVHVLGVQGTTLYGLRVTDRHFVTSATAGDSWQDTCYAADAATLPGV